MGRWGTAWNHGLCCLLVVPRLLLVVCSKKFCYWALIFCNIGLTYNQLNNNLTAQAATMTLHGVPNDVLSNLDPLTLIVLIPICDLFVSLQNLGKTNFGDWERFRYIPSFVAWVSTSALWRRLLLVSWLVPLPWFGLQVINLHVNLKFYNLHTYQLSNITSTRYLYQKQFLVPMIHSHLLDQPLWQPCVWVHWRFSPQCLDSIRIVREL